jgi:CBS domain-containing protein
LAGAVIWAIIVIYQKEGGTEEFSPDKAVDNIHSLLAIVLPLMAAWVGAVVAFYFTRENLDASARNIQNILGQVGDKRLQKIRAGDIMIRLRQIDAVKTPSDDSKSLDEAVQRLASKGIGRLIVLTDDGKGRGVLHDADATNFILSKVKGGANVTGVKVSDILNDTAFQKSLKESVVFATEDTSLAQIKEAMEKKSKETRERCRDAFVTANGSDGSPVVGYISDKDIAKHGEHG